MLQRMHEADFCDLNRGRTIPTSIVILRRPTLLLLEKLFLMVPFRRIGTKTMSIMARGHCNDILVATSLYSPAAGLSDIGEVIEEFATMIAKPYIEEAYEHIFSARTYRHRIAQIAAVVG